MWVHRLCRDWLDKQVAKRAAQEAAKCAQAEIGRQAPAKRQRPKVRFEAGQTAEASVLNMLEAKLLGSRVNRSVVKHLFEYDYPASGLYACVALRWHACDSWLCSSSRNGGDSEQKGCTSSLILQE
jgi:hypothetical protein